MKRFFFFLILVSLAYGCAGTTGVLGPPTFVSGTANDLAPEVTNPDEVLKAMHARYPPLLRDAGIRGRAIILLSVDENGEVRQVSLDESSGDRALDEIAQEVAWTIRFKPPELDDPPAPARVRIPIHLIPPTAVRAQRRRG